MRLRNELLFAGRRQRWVLIGFEPCYRSVGDLQLELIFGALGAIEPIGDVYSDLGTPRLRNIEDLLNSVVIDRGIDPQSTRCRRIERGDAIAESFQRLTVARLLGQLSGAQPRSHRRIGIARIGVGFAQLR